MIRSSNPIGPMSWTSISRRSRFRSRRMQVTLCTTNARIWPREKSTDSSRDWCRGRHEERTDTHRDPAKCGPQAIDGRACPALQIALGSGPARSHFRSNTTSNTSIARSPSSESSPLVLVGARSRSPNAARRCPPSSSCISNRNPTSSPSRLAASPLITVNAGSFTVSDRICRPNTPFLSIYFIF